MRAIRIILPLLALALPAHSATLFVSKSGDGTDGTSWETAHTALSDAIQGSATNDTIWVAAGVYVENVTIEVPLFVLGGFKGDESLGQIDLRNPEANPTIFDGNLQGTVVVAESDLLLDGVTIRNGKAEEGSGLRGEDCKVELRNVRVVSNGVSETGTGGGVHQTGGGLRIEHSFVAYNLAHGIGGGVYATGSSLQIENTEFRENTSLGFGSGIHVEKGKTEIFSTRFYKNGFIAGIERGARGGGVRVLDGQLAIKNSWVEENSTSGLLVSSSSVEVFNTEFVRNDGGNRGGGIYVHAKSEFTVDRCVFRENVANALIPPLGVSEAGAIYSQDSTGKVSNSLFIHNQSHSGNSVHSFLTAVGALGFENCTFDMTPYDDIYSLTEVSWADNPPFFLNCIFAGREKSIFRNLDAHVGYSNIQGGYPGEGNIDADPLFVDPDHGDYHLQRGSPCIDSGTDTGLDHDFDGNFRPIGDYDMGAFEFPFLRSDIDGSGKVDAEDLLIFQEDWKKVSGS